jgi:flagellar hook-associated protein 2
MSPVTTIDGINSGLNTTEILDSIMAVERQPAVLMENQKADQTNIISTLKAFQAKLLAVSTEAAKLARSSTYEQTSVQLSDEGYLTVTASGRAAEGSYDVSVLSLARNHQVASQGFDSEAEAVFGTGTIDIVVGDGSSVQITVDTSNNSLTGIRDAINKAKAGVTASIVNDGSGANAYRLVLTGNKTGVKNKISLTSNLSGTTSLNVTTATFDVPEEGSVAGTTTAALSLGATAAYTGTSNKTYSFTVGGSGVQTVGSDMITLNWTDGTNSGTIVVSQADTEVELVGTGADGLKLSFGAGNLTAGDTFDVSTFAPLLQDASDAKLAIGSATGYGSPITISSETNEFKQVISGLTLNLTKETAVGETINITTSIDVDGIKSSIKALLDKFNDATKFVDDQNSYNSDTQEAGTLLGDYSLQTMSYSLRSAVGTRIIGLDSKYNQLATIGIRTNASGQLVIADPNRLEAAIRENFDDVVNLFVDSGNSSNNGISFVSSSGKTRVGEEYEVNITQAATRGLLRGSGLTSPSATPLTLTTSNNRLKLTVDGLLSDEIVLTARTYNSTEDLVKEIQAKIDNDAKIGTRGVTAQWVETGADTGYLEIVSSQYGSGSSVKMTSAVPDSAQSVLGFGNNNSVVGKDVAGTINGEPAEGKGQVLTGKDGNAKTEGLKLRVTLDESQVGDTAEGTVVVAKGIAAKLSHTITSLTEAGEGMLDSRIKSYEKQVQNLTDRIAEFDVRLALRRESLEKKWYGMEQALGQLNSLGTYLSGQITSINANWN